MGTYSFKLPDIGEGIAEAEIVAWHVAPGDIVEEDAPLADLMTDKATVEMTAPVAGKVVKIAGEVGEQIAIGSILAVFEVEGDAEAAPEPTPAIEVAPNEAAQVVKPDPEPSPVPLRAEDGETGSAARSSAAPVASPAPLPDALPKGEREHVRVLASPAVRQRAKDLGIDLAQIKTAEVGRVRHADLDAFLSYNAGGGYRAPGGGARADEQVKVIGLRRRIAENMQAAKRHIPHFTYVEEIDVTRLEELRADLNATRGAKPKITMLPLLITAICKTLPDFPMINARYDDEAGIVTRSGAVHLGMATQTDAGLMVPVIRSAQERNIWQLASEIVRLADAARGGKARSEELSGSTLTITSLGPLGGIATTPVINRPEVAIIGPNKVVERPVFRDGQVVAAKLMNLSISCDHRVVDGWDAARFVQALKRLLETPALLFVD
ncbi:MULTISPECIES: dihydrolipoamide acetyltransferase family protein [unclassified Sphingomonas]|uniref:dihydrolipoamide acetyltransferase family protein n=1 Tax=unclassified Sphingomonas TaxID=196159 RepID=UPI0006F31BBE|nr:MULTISPECIES: dihydrolipoamide acetyltransferase family protein [unclassified Sphingomonas]KQX24841.1 branched-chain alpha-keto acid dehydrogenase subunit E2 [Sphingomonas sp. Root1294]KQY69829.1 branched-chain alpha-keto acid dehydrogenase subunit E2 [Sphingomonas sp. Root50]KRB93944.1 branched-chain alpha-keto acid dehydrogenase subunit E2 [Sphingomonas sp. Root720]